MAVLNSASAGGAFERGPIGRDAFPGGSVQVILKIVVVALFARRYRRFGGGAPTSHVTGGDVA
jgi:hypothetical protein